MCPQLFNSLGLHIDASSGYEIDRAMRAGVPASHISLSSQVRASNETRRRSQSTHNRGSIRPPPNHQSPTTRQELPPDFDKWVQQGVQINACSVQQLERFGQKFPGGKVRFEP